jgi:hypothetical protein
MAKQPTNKRTTIDCEINLDSGELIIRLPLTIPPSPSASGKTMVIGSTRGNVRTSATFEGKPITIGVNAYFPK